MMTVADVEGSYTIPYIQSDRDLEVVPDFSDSDTAFAHLTLSGAKFRAAGKMGRGGRPVVFRNIPGGELSLGARWLGRDGSSLKGEFRARLGVGSVLAALGDSLTEGYHGRGFMPGGLTLKAEDFPVTAVSKDGRNFPQFAPTARSHKPSVSCFQSWMTELNDGLSAAWRMPVFIANEGWGGLTSGDYLSMIGGSKGGWKDRMSLLRPDTWLVHLGVNDERQGVSAKNFAENMRGIVLALITGYGARPSRIYLARPSYYHAAGAADTLRSYIAEIERLTQDFNLKDGPDFFGAFSKDRAFWCGNDPVHPGVEGMSLMAKLWLASLADNIPYRRKGRRSGPENKRVKIMEEAQ
jgi:lysophospholipase L1-like esterase